MQIKRQPKPKQCPCGVKFTPARSIQKYHSPACELKFKTGNVAPEDYSKLSWSTLYAMATGAFQAARKKELEPKCYTCGREAKPLHCGHAFKKELYRGMVFDESTTRIQCDFCNVGLDGNTVEFHRRLKAELGEKEWQAIELDAYANRDKQWHRTELIEVIEKFTAKTQELKEQRK